MNESEIKNHFNRLAQELGDVPKEVEHVFSVLVSSTLRYRDKIKEETGIVLTVEDVRVALGWLMDTMGSGRFPETDNAVRFDLLKAWLAELSIPEQ